MPNQILKNDYTTQHVSTTDYTVIGVTTIKTTQLKVTDTSGKLIKLAHGVATGGGISQKASAENQSIAYQAVTAGTAGNLLNVTVVDPGSESQSLDVSVTSGTDIEISLETNAAVAASLDLQNVHYDANVAGAAGNNISITYTLSADGGSTSASSTGDAITVILAAETGTASLEFSDINYVANAPGASGDALTMRYINGSTGTTSAAVLVSAITVTLGVADYPAGLTYQDIDYTAVTPGSGGNAITIEYVADPTPDEGTSVDVVGNAITVMLGTTDSQDAATDIQDLNYQSLLPGDLGNNISITYTTGSFMGSLVVGVIGDAISVALPTEPRTATLDFGDLFFTATSAGSAGNSISVQYVLSGGGSTSTSVVGTAITVNLAIGDSPAFKTIQDIDYSAVTGGSGGNSISIEYVLAGSPGGSTTAAAIGSAITVTLATEESFAGATIQRTDYTANDAGSGGNSISVEYINDGVGGSETVDVTGSAITVHMEDGVSTCQNISDAVNNSPYSSVLVSVSPRDPELLQEAMDATNLTGGGVPNNIATAQEVVDAIAASVSALVSAEVSGDDEVQQPTSPIFLSGGQTGISVATAQDVYDSITSSVPASALVDTELVGDHESVQGATSVSNLSGGGSAGFFKTGSELVTAILANGSAAALVNVSLGGDDNIQTFQGTQFLTDGYSEPIATAQDVADAITASMAASALVNTDVTGDPESVQSPGSAQNLTGGGVFSSATAQDIYDVTSIGAVAILITPDLVGDPENIQNPAGPQNFSGGALHSVAVADDIADIVNGAMGPAVLVTATGDGDSEPQQPGGPDNLGDGADYEFISTAQNISDALNNDVAISALITTSTDDPEFIVQPDSTFFLSGGTSGGSGYTDAVDLFQLPVNGSITLPLGSETVIPVGAVILLKSINGEANSGANVTTLLS